MKKILSMIMIAMMVIMVGCGQSSNGAAEGEETNGNDAAPANKLEQILASGKIVVGTSADYPPYEFHAMIDGKDQIVGFDVEVMKEIAAGLGVTLEIQDMGFDAVLAGVETGLIDIGVAGINASPDREDAMDFSNVYYSAVQTILVAKDKVNEYNGIASLDGKTVGAQIGSIQETMAKESLTNSQVKSLTKVTDLILELKTGMVDGVMVEMAVAQSYAKQNPDLAVAESIIFEDMEGGSTVITANGETELMAEINKILADMVASGRIDTYVAEANALVENAVE